MRTKQEAIARSERTPIFRLSPLVFIEISKTGVLKLANIYAMCKKEGSASASDALKLIRGGRAYDRGKI